MVVVDMATGVRVVVGLLAKGRTALMTEVLVTDAAGAPSKVKLRCTCVVAPSTGMHTYIGEGYASIPP